MVSLVLLLRQRGQLSAATLAGELEVSIRTVLRDIDALPESYQATAADVAQRLLIDPETDLLSHRLVDEEAADAIVSEVRRAVFAGHRLRIH